MIYFVSSNPQKFDDVRRIFRGSKPALRLLEQPLVEVLSQDLEVVVTEKAKAAYKTALVPLFVEHGALHIDHLNGFPGPMVKLFWERLRDQLPSLIPAGASRRAHVTQMVCHCDGKKLHVFEGTIKGTIAPKKRGDRGMHWEPMFIPDGHDKTLGEMSPNDRIAAHGATIACKKLRKYLGI
jgi:non-canonical purine NTP pyrophosphatase (RdgB/HAM1 family)